MRHIAACLLITSAWSPAVLGSILTDDPRTIYASPGVYFARGTTPGAELALLWDRRVSFGDSNYRHITIAPVFGGTFSPAGPRYLEAQLGYYRSTNFGHGGEVPDWWVTLGGGPRRERGRAPASQATFGVGCFLVPFATFYARPIWGGEQRDAREMGAMFKLPLPLPL